MPPTIGRTAGTKKVSSRPLSLPSSLPPSLPPLPHSLLVRKRRIRPEQHISFCLFLSLYLSLQSLYDIHTITPHTLAPAVEVNEPLNLILTHSLTLLLSHPPTHSLTHSLSHSLSDPPTTDAHTPVAEVSEPRELSLPVLPQNISSETHRQKLVNGWDLRR